MRCCVCNYSPNIDGLYQDNYMEEGYDTCLKCASIIENTLTEYGYDDEDLGTDPEIDATGPRKPVQTDPESVSRGSEGQPKCPPQTKLEDIEIDTYTSCLP